MVSKTGVWTNWEAEGVVSKESIFDGTSRSTWTVWRPDGQKWAEGSTLSAHFEGAYKEYHPNGQLAAEGRSIVFISSEFGEIVGVCNRVLVLSEGELVAEVIGSDITETRLLEHCYGHSQTAAT